MPSGSRTMRAAEVRLDQVGKRYGTQWVVRDVELYIGRGEFFTFLGPSGCGKTTLLRMIAGFVAPEEGIVFLDGQPVNDVPPWRRDVGMVFQNYALWPHLSVFDNVAFGLRERKVPRDDIKRRVTEALRQVDLTGTENRRPSQLSGGQQQRVALARTLVIQPRVMLLDEPLSNLDAKLRVEMRLELLKLQREIGLTTIYVTHDQEEALAMSTRIAVMSEGRVVQEGTPREIYEHPQDKFVAAFVGGSNLFSGQIKNAGAEAIEVQTDEGFAIYVCRQAFPALPAAGQSVLLSVRPEGVELNSAGDFAQANRLPGEIVASAYQGAFVEYEIQTPGGLLRARAVSPKGKVVYRRGDRVRVGFAPEDVTVVRETSHGSQPYLR
jgi:iron(III) transport system ATP-binding protein